MGQYPNKEINGLEKNVVQKAFEEITTKRIYQAAWEKCQADPHHKEAHKKAATLFHMLSDLLTTDEQQKVLDALEAAIWNEAGYFIEYSYRQGLQDSQGLHKQLSEIGISVTKESVTYV